MSKKVIKYFFELVFIFVIPLLILVINCNYENTIVYDNNGNFQSTEKHIEFTTPFIYIDKKYNTTSLYEMYLNHEYILPNGSIIKLNKIKTRGTYLGQDVYILLYHVGTINYLYGINVNNESQLLCWRGNYLIQDVNVITSNTEYIEFQLTSDLNLQFVEGYTVNSTIEIYEKTDYTIWGRLKNVFVHDLELQDNFVIDFIITYTILWFIMFIIWHIIYLLFDKLFHIRKE